MFTDFENLAKAQVKHVFQDLYGFFLKYARISLGSSFITFMDNKKKTIFIIIGIVEAVVLIFCLVISILVLRNFDNTNTAMNIVHNGQFIGTLQNDHVLFFCTIVLPVFVIFLADGAYLIVYANKKASMLGETIVQKNKKWLF